MKRSRWDLSTVEICFVEDKFESLRKEHGTRLDEVAAAIYEYLCQLEKIDHTIETTVTEAPIFRRTGTDG